MAVVPVMDAPGGEDILLGRIDLLVAHRGGGVTVIDFKAGRHAASVLDGTPEIPGLSTYAWQLRGYREALVAAGVRVRGTGLVYVRGPSTAFWEE